MPRPRGSRRCFSTAFADSTWRTDQEMSPRTWRRSPLPCRGQLDRAAAGLDAVPRRPGVNTGAPRRRPALPPQSQCLGSHGLPPTSSARFQVHVVVQGTRTTPTVGWPTSRAAAPRELVVALGPRAPGPARDSQIPTGSGSPRPADCRSWSSLARHGPPRCRRCFRTLGHTVGALLRRTDAIRSLHARSTPPPTAGWTTLIALPPDPRASRFRVRGRGRPSCVQRFPRRARHPFPLTRHRRFGYRRDPPKAAKPGPTVAIAPTWTRCRWAEDRQELSRQGRGKMHSCGAMRTIDRIAGSDAVGHARVAAGPRDVHLPARGNLCARRRNHARLTTCSPAANSDFILGFHNWPPAAAGTVGWHVDACMASSDAFDVTIKGDGRPRRIRTSRWTPSWAQHFVDQVQTIVNRESRRSRQWARSRAGPRATSSRPRSSCRRRCARWRQRPPTRCRTPCGISSSQGSRPACASISRPYVDQAHAGAAQPQTDDGARARGRARMLGPQNVIEMPAPSMGAAGLRLVRRADSLRACASDRRSRDTRRPSIARTTSG